MFLIINMCLFTCETYSVKKSKLFLRDKYEFRFIESQIN
jgi:hypothetical protein